MNKLESAMVSVTIGITCPLLTFVAFWWAGAALYLSSLPVRAEAVIVAAFAGLGLGCLLDLLYLRSWTRQFYRANSWFLISVYLCLCVVAVAFCMGFPAGTLLLGVAAGAYMGRRERHRLSNQVRARAFVRRAALFAAFVTAAAAFPVGILALRERELMTALETDFGLSHNSLNGVAGPAMIGFLTVLLFAIQYGCSFKAGSLAFSIGESNTPRVS